MNFFCWDTDRLATKEDIHRLENLLRQFEHSINMKVSEIPAFISSIKDELIKAKTEILDKIAALEAATADAELSPEAVAALDDLKATAQGIDAIVPDVPPITDSGPTGSTLRG